MDIRKEKELWELVMDLRLKNFLMPPHHLTNFERVNLDYKNEPRFKGVYSRGSFPKIIKYEPYVVNLDEYGDVGTHRIVLYVEILK